MHQTLFLYWRISKQRNWHTVSMTKTKMLIHFLQTLYILKTETNCGHAYHCTTIVFTCFQVQQVGPGVDGFSHGWGCSRGHRDWLSLKSHLWGGWCRNWREGRRPGLGREGHGHLGTPSLLQTVVAKIITKFTSRLLQLIVFWFFQRCQTKQKQVSGQRARRG